MSEEVEKKEEQGKVRKKFEAALANFTLIIGGGSLFKPTKLLPKQIQEAIKELAAEEVKIATDKFKADARALIQEKRDHDKHVAQLKKDFEKKEEESMKKFAEKAAALEKTLTNIRDIEKGYYDTLIGAVGGGEPEKLADGAKESKE